MKYFTASENLSKRYDAISRQNGFKATSVDEYRIWKTHLRRVLSELIGLEYRPLLPCPKVEQVSVEQLDGYKRIKLLIETEPDIVMPTYMLVPDGIKAGECRAAIIATNGHGSNGKEAVCGVTTHKAVETAIGEFNYAYGVEFVRMGLIVFSCDARGFGERREKFAQGDEKVLDCSCTYLNNMAMPLGKTVVGMWIFDLMRLLDYITTLDTVNPQRIGCAGLSGGGLQALWLGALDDRLACVVDSGYFYGYKQALFEQYYNCSCNYVPHLWEQVDMGDLGAMIAPTPFFVETGDVDGLNGATGVANVITQVAIAKGAYALFQMEINMHHHVFSGAHKWDGTKSLAFIKEVLLR